jgi:hypothetical protein
MQGLQSNCYTTMELETTKILLSVWGNVLSISSADARGLAAKL